MKAKKNVFIIISNPSNSENYCQQFGYFSNMSIIGQDHSF